MEAMTTVETGTAVKVEYIPEEKRSTAIHEAGHAGCLGHAYEKNSGLDAALDPQARSGALRPPRLHRARSRSFHQLALGVDRAT